LNEESKTRQITQIQFKEDVREITKLIREIEKKWFGIECTETSQRAVSKRFTMMDFRDVRDEYSSERAGPSLARPITKRANEILEKWQNEE